MCGIAGIYNASKEKAALTVLAQQLIRQLQHRGPDGADYQVIKQSRGGNLLLVHTRLSIIDLTSEAAQPMFNQAGNLVITFNGELYNYQTIRKQLQSQGYTFRTQSDTEVVLAAYEVWGEKCFAKFNGMWALAIWNAKENRLILSRDRLGIKPLFIAKFANTYYFASTPGAILTASQQPAQLARSALGDYFSFRYCLTGGSFFRGIEPLEPGSILSLSAEGIKKTAYWQLSPTAKIAPSTHRSIDEVSHEVEARLKQAVQYRLVADVPVGAFLSGGLDSSLLVALMARANQTPLHTYSIGFGQGGFNENDYAMQVARHCQTIHVAEEMTAADYFSRLSTLLTYKSEPLAVPNELALFRLATRLKQDVKVVLSGEGADELFAGYGRIFRSAFDFERMKYSDSYLSNEMKRNFSLKYGACLPSNAVTHFLGQYCYLDYATQAQLLTEDYLQLDETSVRHLQFFNEQFESLTPLNLTEKYIWIFQRYHLPGLLGRLDNATMAASVEGRVPFVDYQLIDFVNALPLSYKLPWKSDVSKSAAAALNSDQISGVFDTPKFLLREISQAYLPKEIIDRPKMGFPVPLTNWLSENLLTLGHDLLLAPSTKSRGLFKKKYLEQVLLSSKQNLLARDKQAYLLWMLINVEQWMRTFNVSL